MNAKGTFAYITLCISVCPTSFTLHYELDAWILLFSVLSVWKRHLHFEKQFPFEVSSLAMTEAAPGPISMLKEWINTFLPLPPSLLSSKGKEFGRTLGGSWQMCQKTSRGLSIARTGEHWQFDLVPDGFSASHLKMDAGGIDSIRKALAVHVIMEKIRRKVLGEIRDQYRGTSWLELTFSY